jgi:hypothetical protein
MPLELRPAQTGAKVQPVPRLKLPMDEVHRSLCAINLSLEVFGDRWSLLIIRDMVFAGKRHFRDLHLGAARGDSTRKPSAPINEFLRSSTPPRLRKKVK